MFVNEVQMICRTDASAGLLMNTGTMASVTALIHIHGVEQRVANMHRVAAVVRWWWQHILGSTLHAHAALDPASCRCLEAYRRRRRRESRASCSTSSPGWCLKIGMAIVSSPQSSQTSAATPLPHVCSIGGLVSSTTFKTESTITKGIQRLVGTAKGWADRPNQ
mmetsp:Transcript_11924/g.30161  ORF Transcript_11924/g.30161 Transcript_11924/m.30161 type:complete len:164 (+) Transcript_11924:35-526(+)